MEHSDTCTGITNYNESKTANPSIFVYFFPLAKMISLKETAYCHILIHV